MLKQIITGIFIIITLSCFGQTNQIKDQDLLLGYVNSSDKVKYADRHIHFQLLRNKNFLSKVNPVNLSLSALMYVYKKSVSPQISATCMYAPSCSSYSKELFAHYGILKAMFCTSDRLSRCNRIAASSIHWLRYNEHDHKVHESFKYYQIKEEKEKAE